MLPWLPPVSYYIHDPHTGYLMRVGPSMTEYIKEDKKNAKTVYTPTDAHFFDNTQCDTEEKGMMIIMDDLNDLEVTLTRAMIIALKERSPHNGNNNNEFILPDGSFYFGNVKTKTRALIGASTGCIYSLQEELKNPDEDDESILNAPYYEKLGLLDPKDCVIKKYNIFK